jgi:hypothetical protein
VRNLHHRRKIALHFDFHLTIIELALEQLGGQFVPRSFIPLQRFSAFGSVLAFACRGGGQKNV